MVKPNFESSLISMVRSHKELYDTRVRKSREGINQIWEDIAIALNTDENYCRSRWRNLRNRYRKIKVNIQARGGIARYIRKWRHFHEMSFVDPFLLTTDKLSVSDEESQSQHDGKSLLRFDERLVDLVRHYEFIYNKDHRLYHQRAETREAWAEIAGKINSDPKTCREQWLVQRSVYQKLKKKVNEKGGLSQYTPQWRLFSKMAFVDKWDSTNLLPEFKHSPLDANEFSIEFISEDEMRDESNFNTEISLENDELFSNEFAPEAKPRSKTYIRRRNKDIVHCNTTSESEIELNEAPQVNKFQYIRRSNKNKVDISCKTECTTASTATPKADSSCGTYFSMLGMRIDEMSVPARVRYDLERRITHLVYDVLSTHSEEANNLKSYT